MWFNRRFRRMTKAARNELSRTPWDPEVSSSWNCTAMRPTQRRIRWNKLRLNSTLPRESAIILRLRNPNQAGSMIVDVLAHYPQHKYKTQVGSICCQASKTV